MTYTSTNYIQVQLRPNGPVHDEYTYHYEDWVTLRDVFMGQRQIKSQKTRYLPQRPGMTDTDYKDYLDRALFFSITKKTLESLTGSIFRRKTTVAVPKALTYLIESATSEGQPLAAFIEKLAEENLGMGRAGVLIDMTSTPSSAASHPYALQPEKSPINKPYFAFYKTEYILDWKWERDVFTNERLLTRVVLAEYPDSTTKDNVIRVLALVPGEEGLKEYCQWTANPDSPDVPLTPIVYPTRNGVRLNKIPFFFFTPEDNEASPKQSPLLPISQINISHYQSSALLESARNFVGTPQYWLRQAGQRDETTEYFVSANKIWLLGEDDSVGIIEYHGQGLTFLENALTEKSQQMASLGAKLFSNQRKQAALSTAQLQNTQNSEESILLKLVNNMNYQLTRMVKTVAWWLNVSEKEIAEIEVALNTNFDPPEMDARVMRSIQSLYESGIFPVSIIYMCFKDAGMIPADMSLEEFKQMLTVKGETPNNEGPIPYQPPVPTMSESPPSPKQTRKAPATTKAEPTSDKPASNPGDGKTDK